MARSKYLVAMLPLAAFGGSFLLDGGRSVTPSRPASTVLASASTPCVDCECKGSFEDHLVQIPQTCPPNTTGSMPLIIPSSQNVSTTTCPANDGICSSTATNECQGTVDVVVSFPTNPCISTVWIRSGAETPYPVPTQINNTSQTISFSVSPECNSSEDTGKLEVWDIDPATGGTKIGEYYMTASCSNCQLADG